MPSFRIHASQTWTCIYASETLGTIQVWSLFAFGVPTYKRLNAWPSGLNL